MGVKCSFLSPCYRRNDVLLLLPSLVTIPSKIIPLKSLQIIQYPGNWSSAVPKPAGSLIMCTNPPPGEDILQKLTWTLSPKWQLESLLANKCIVQTWNLSPKWLQENLLANKCLDQITHSVMIGLYKYGTSTISNMPHGVRTGPLFVSFSDTKLYILLTILMPF